MVASSAPLDQYMVEHPEYFFEGSPEHAHINATIWRSCSII
jgi:DEAD/DEAH box helicase domain-containing protein